MIDIFEEKKQPLLYIADIYITFKTKTRSKKKKEFIYRKVCLKGYPIILLDNYFPTEKSKNKFLLRVFNANNIQGEFDSSMITIEKIENIKLSSSLMYKFDYNLD